MARPVEPGRSRADEVIALGCARGLTDEAIAGEARVSVRTVRHRLADSGFRQRVQEMRTELIAQAAGRLAATMGKAVAVLADLLDSATERVRLRAALGIVDACLRVAADAEFRERIDALEARLGEDRR